MSALYGGLIIAGISAIPGLNLLNCFCCAGVLLGGFLAVFFYKQEIKDGMEPMTRTDCVTIGAAAGVIASVAGTAISVVVLLVYGNVATETMLKIIESMNLQLPPEFQQALDDAMNERPTIGSVATSFLFTLVGDVVFAVLGSLIGWGVFRPRFAPPGTRSN